MVSVVHDTSVLCPFLLVVCRMWGPEQVLAKCNRPRRLLQVQRCRMSGTALWVRWYKRTSKTDFQQVRGKLFWHFKWNTSVSNPHWPLMCLPIPSVETAGLGFAVRAVGLEGAQQIGSNPWSLQPKLISHVSPSAWVTDLKDRTLLISLVFSPLSALLFPDFSILNPTRNHRHLNLQHMQTENKHLWGSQRLSWGWFAVLVTHDLKVSSHK